VVDNVSRLNQFKTSASTTIHRVAMSNAAVTIVEFTDFQCPACAAMHPVLEEVLKSYGNKVRFVVRDFPLNQHEWARKAAEAANAANAQGKFFEYIAVLFKNQKALDVPSLKKYASDLGLDRARLTLHWTAACTPRKSRKTSPTARCTASAARQRYSSTGYNLEF
jgi:protein-disulfide isomerase